MDEIWKDIIGYEGLYQVSNMGNARSLFRYKKILKPLKTSVGYYQVQLSNRKVIKPLLLHRLVAVAFISNPNNLPQVNHIDGDKLNNNFANLEWCSASDNQKHAYKIKLKKSANLGKFGKEHHSSRAISQYDIYGNLVNKFFSTREANRETLINQGSIAACARGERRTAGGFIWQYEE